MMPQFFEQNMGKFGLALVVVLALAGITFIPMVHTWIGDDYAMNMRWIAFGAFIAFAGLINLRTEREIYYRDRNRR